MGRKPTERVALIYRNMDRMSTLMNELRSLRLENERLEFEQAQDRCRRRGGNVIDLQAWRNTARFRVRRQTDTAA